MYKNQIAKIKIAVFASGAGSNAEKIIHYFKNHPFIEVSLIVSSKKEAGVLFIAKENHIPSIIINKEKFFNDDAYLNELKTKEIDCIVLAGFLWKVPKKLIEVYPNKIINIHPALLPRYGGKGMYGHFVHDAVIANKEKESGITVHVVDDQYDHGKIIFQAKCEVSAEDTAETLAQKIHFLEHSYYPEVIENYLK